MGVGGGLAKILVCAALGVALLFGNGCARPPPHKSDALARSRALLDRVDRLEADLHSQGSEIFLYGELGARRQTATEITCQVAASHVREISRLDQAQQKKRKEKANRLAMLRHERTSSRRQQ